MSDFIQELEAFQQLYKQYSPVLDTGLVAFSRILGFVYLAPIFNRKDLFFMIKLVFAVYLTCCMVWVIPGGIHSAPKEFNWFAMAGSLFTNLSVGALLGFVCDMIMVAVASGGDMANNQIGLSSAMFMDPASKKQTALLEGLYTFIATVVFMEMGGLHWLIQGLYRSFEMFPLFETNLHLEKTLHLSYLIRISGNILLVATQMVAPVIVITMAIDLILGITNRTAQQIQVFQLSAALKPAIGMAVIMVTLPIFLNVLQDYFNDFSRFF